jgi:cob(I)alamin adenosyltransferase
MRSVGHGNNVRIIQFMKGCTYTGELISAAKLGIEIYQFGRTCPHAAVIKSGYMSCQKCGSCWIGKDNITELDRNKIQWAWELSQKTVKEGKHQLVILDEIINVFNYDLLELDDVVRWLKALPKNVEVVLTGRNAPEALVEIADLVSDIKQVKHPYEQGVEARRGIEY